MGKRRRGTGWVGGWRAFLGHADIAGYRDLGWCARRRLDGRMLIALAGVPVVRRVAAYLVPAHLASLVVVWRFDLTGWQADLLRMLPMFVAFPWLAAARRRCIERLVASAHADSRRSSQTSAR